MYRHVLDIPEKSACCCQTHLSYPVASGVSDSPFSNLSRGTLRSTTVERSVSSIAWIPSARKTASSLDTLESGYGSNTVMASSLPL